MLAALLPLSAGGLVVVKGLRRRPAVDFGEAAQSPPDEQPAADDAGAADVRDEVTLSAVDLDPDESLRAGGIVVGPLLVADQVPAAGHMQPAGLAVLAGLVKRSAAQPLPLRPWQHVPQVAAPQRPWNKLHPQPEGRLIAAGVNHPPTMPDRRPT